MSKQPKIILWDIETSLMITTTFSLYPDRIPHDGILQDWFIICGAWKELGKETKSVQISKNKDDKQVCKTLREALIDADIIVHHNGDKFDLKKLNARLIYHGLDPLPHIATVDTLKEVKKIAQFTSNRLDYLGKFLFGEGKVSHDQGMWLEIAKGDISSVPKMVEYNIGDVEVLEKVYLRLRPYMKNHPVITNYMDMDKHGCNKCGSINLINRGYSITAAGVKEKKVSV